MTNGIPSGMLPADHKVKERVFKSLGGKCAKCSFNDWRALELDHIEAATKPKDEPGGIRLYRLVDRSKRPLEDFQLLCNNCHAIKTYEELEKLVLSRKADKLVAFFGTPEAAIAELRKRVIQMPKEAKIQ